MRAPYAMGLMWDHFTPQVEGQVIRDVLAIQAQPSTRELTVYYDGTEPQLDGLLQTMGVRRAPTKELATLWVLYQTGPDPLDPPDNAKEVVVRDMQVRLTAPNLNTDEHSGFYLAPQGRNISPTLDLNRPMPGWYPGGPPASIVWLWS